MAYYPVRNGKPIVKDKDQPEITFEDGRYVIGGHRYSLCQTVAILNLALPDLDNIKAAYVKIANAAKNEQRQQEEAARRKHPQKDGIISTK